MTLKRQFSVSIVKMSTEIQSGKSEFALIIRSAVCALSMCLALSPLRAQETQGTAETKPTQQEKPAPAAPGKPEAKPSDPELLGAVYFLDPGDQSLKPLPKEPAKVVAKASGFRGNKRFIQIPGSASTFRLKSGQDLVFVIKCTDPENYELYPFEGKKDKRETLVAKATTGTFLKTSVERLDNTIKMDVSKYGEMSYRFVVKAPEPGEYGFPVKWDVYNFGVDPK